MGNVCKLHTYFISFLLLFIANSSSLLSSENPISLTAAIRKLLEAGPGVQIEHEMVRQSEGMARRASGQFDWMLTNALSIDRIHKPLSSNMSNYERNESFSLGIGRQFRNGISFSLAASSLDLEDNITNVKPVNGSDVSALIIVPLLRGLGSRNTGAEELAAKAAVVSTSFLTRYYISEQIFQLTATYWNYLAALKYLEIQKEKEENDIKMLQIVEKLVSSGEMAPVYLEQSQANLDRTRISISDAQLNLSRVKFDMGVLMGYSPAQLEDVPVPGDKYPEIIDSEILREDLQGELIAESLEKRGDYLASLKNVDTEEIYLHQARNIMKPSLNFNWRVGYSGFDDSDRFGRFFDTFTNNISGMNSFVGFQLELPIVNNNARGMVDYRQSLVRKSQLESFHLSNNISSEVSVAFEVVRRSIFEYQLAKEAAERFYKVVNYEMLKAKSGSPDLTAMYDVLDRYNGSRIAQNEALRKYAVSLAQLRFVTGTVLLARETDWTYLPGTMVQLPITN